MRRLIAIFVFFALTLAFLRDPFSHLHDGQDHSSDQPSHHDLSLIFHLHVELLLPQHDETSLDAPQRGHKAQPVSFFQLKQDPPPSLPFKVEPVAFFSPPILLGRTACEPTPRTHDPPLAYASFPRSPPA
jgi:hypothetical protein